MTDQPQILSIIMPAYNEQPTIKACIRRVMNVPLPLARELIIVDDASSDGTGQEIAAVRGEFPAEQITAIRQERNQGKGAALRAALAAVKGDIVLIQDADLEYSPDDYPRLLKPILDGRADVVFGSRFLTTDEHRVLYYWHAVGNKFLTWFSNVCTNLNLTDMECCYKVFRTEVIRSFTLKSQRFGIEPELTAKVAKRQCRIYEVGISYSGRTYEEGKKITWKDGLKALASIVRFRFFN